jgi:hypothetical protein
MTEQLISYIDGLGEVGDISISPNGKLLAAVLDQFYVYV